MLPLPSIRRSSFLAVAGGLAEVDLLAVGATDLDVVFSDGDPVVHAGAVLRGPVPSQVPFPDHGSMVSLAFQHGGDRHLILADHRFFPPDAGIRTKRIHACQEPVPGGMA